MGKITIQPIPKSSSDYTDSIHSGAKTQLQINGNFMDIAVSPADPDKKLIESLVFQLQEHSPTPLSVNLNNQDVEVAIYWNTREERISLGDMKVSILDSDAAQPLPLLTVYVRAYKLRQDAFQTYREGDQSATWEYVEGYSIPFFHPTPILILPGSTPHSFFSYGDATQPLSKAIHVRPVRDLDRSPMEVANSR